MNKSKYKKSEPNVKTQEQDKEESQNSAGQSLFSDNEETAQKSKSDIEDLQSDMEDFYSDKLIRTDLLDKDLQDPNSTISQFLREYEVKTDKKGNLLDIKSKKKGAKSNERGETGRERKD